MRVWRDIPPARAWETLLQPVIQSLKNRDTQALMSSLLDAIKVYDLLRKDALDTLEDRARLLDIIAEKADELFATAYKYHVDQVKRDTKAGKAALKAQGLTSSAFYVKGDHIAANKKGPNPVSEGTERANESEGAKPDDGPQAAPASS